MYVEDFDAFYQQAEKLLLNDPIRTRYVVKYRHTAGQLVLKVTDDDVVSHSWALSSCAAYMARPWWGWQGTCSHCHADFCAVLEV